MSLTAATPILQTDLIKNSHQNTVTYQTKSIGICPKGSIIHAVISGLKIPPPRWTPAYVAWSLQSQFFIAHFPRKKAANKSLISTENRTVDNCLSFCFQQSTLSFICHQVQIKYSRKGWFTDVNSYKQP